MSQVYNKLSKNKDKMEYRAKWLEGKYEDYLKERVETTSLTEEQVNEGVYYPILRIAQEEGGGPTGLRAAMSYALRAVQIGGQYVEFDEWTNQVKFLYFTKRVRDTFSTSWSTHQNWRSMVQGALTAAPGESAATGALDRWIWR